MPRPFINPTTGQLVDQKSPDQQSRPLPLYELHGACTVPAGGLAVGSFAPTGLVLPTGARVIAQCSTVRCTAGTAGSTFALQCADTGLIGGISAASAWSYAFTQSAFRTEDVATRIRAWGQVISPNEVLLWSTGAAPLLAGQDFAFSLVFSIDPRAT